jgi:hypothetical protein
MKAQYVGDIGDFGKVLILKHLAGLGFKIGVNWVLTENDKRTDGKHRDYVSYSGKDCLCCCDEEVFEQMLPLARKEKPNRKIEDIEGLIRGFSETVVFHSKKYAGGRARRSFEKQAFEKLSTDLANLVFFDPDNGVGGEVGSSSKHVYLSDLKCYWERKQSLLTYHHLGRRGTQDEQVDRLRFEFQRAFPDGGVYVYQLRRGTARVYIFCVREEHLPKIIGEDQIPAIQPLQMTKAEWAKQGKSCTENHSSRPAATAKQTSARVSKASGAGVFSKDGAVKTTRNSTTNIGYVNKNGQVVIRKTGLRGTDHGQSVYQLVCSCCGHVYGANGADIHLRKCPNCQNGRPGLPIG